MRARRIRGAGAGCDIGEEAIELAFMGHFQQCGSEFHLIRFAQRAGRFIFRRESARLEYLLIQCFGLRIEFVGSIVRRFDSS